MNQELASSPELEQSARLALLGLLSNPVILHTDAQLTNAGLEMLADSAFRAAFYLEQRLYQARKQG